MTPRRALAAVAAAIALLAAGTACTQQQPHCPPGQHAEHVWECS